MASRRRKRRTTKRKASKRKTRKKSKTLTTRVTALERQLSAIKRVAAPKSTARKRGRSSASARPTYIYTPPSHQLN